MGEKDQRHGAQAPAPSNLGSGPQENSFLLLESGAVPSHALSPGQTCGVSAPSSLPSPPPHWVPGPSQPPLRSLTPADCVQTRPSPNRVCPHFLQGRSFTKQHTPLPPQTSFYTQDNGILALAHLEQALPDASSRVLKTHSLLLHVSGWELPHAIPSHAAARC